MLANLRDYFSTLTLDIVIVAGTIFVLFFFGLHFGKSRIIALILSLYLGLLFFNVFPFLDLLLFFKENETQILFSKLLIFTGLVLLVYMAVVRLISVEFPRSNPRRIFEAGLLSLAVLSLLLAFSYHVLPVSKLLTFSGFIPKLFSSSNFFFWWLVAPLAALFVTS